MCRYQCPEGESFMGGAEGRVLLWAGRQPAFFPQKWRSLRTGHRGHRSLNYAIQSGPSGSIDH